MLIEVLTWLQNAHAILFMPGEENIQFIRTKTFPSSVLKEPDKMGISRRPELYAHVLPAFLSNIIKNASSFFEGF